MDEQKKKSKKKKEMKEVGRRRKKYIKGERKEGGPKFVLLSGKRRTSRK